jgi:hypothetical protein
MPIRTVTCSGVVLASLVYFGEPSNAGIIQHRGDGRVKGLLTAGCRYGEL